MIECVDVMGGDRILWCGGSLGAESQGKRIGGRASSNSAYVLGTWGMWGHVGAAGSRAEGTGYPPASAVQGSDVV